VSNVNPSKFSLPLFYTHKFIFALNGTFHSPQAYTHTYTHTHTHIHTRTHTRSARCISLSNNFGTSRKIGQPNKTLIYSLATEMMGNLYINFPLAARGDKTTSLKVHILAVLFLLRPFHPCSLWQNWDHFVFDPFSTSFNVNLMVNAMRFLLFWYVDKMIRLDLMTLEKLPKICGYCWQVVVVERYLYVIRNKIGTPK